MPWPQKHPLAATPVLRAMIEFCLTNSRSSRYKHTAHHLPECSSLSKNIQDFGAFELFTAVVKSTALTTERIFRACTKPTTVGC